jgi:uncharacterized membrane protein YccF (DUF307 family)
LTALQDCQQRDSPRFSLWQFGRTIVSRPDAGVTSGFANILWVVVAGWWLALAHVHAGIARGRTVHAGGVTVAARGALAPVPRWTVRAGHLLVKFGAWSRLCCVG